MGNDIRIKYLEHIKKINDSELSLLVLKYPLRKDRLYVKGVEIDLPFFMHNVTVSQNRHLYAAPAIFLKIRRWDGQNTQHEVTPAEGNLFIHSNGDCYIVLREQLIWVKVEYPADIPYLERFFRKDE